MYLGYKYFINPNYKYFMKDIKMKKILVLLSGIVFGCTAFANESNSISQFPTCKVDANGLMSSGCNLDLQRYLGKWFEQARLPTFFQKDCNSSTAEYSKNEDGSIKVLNTCIKSDGSIKDIVGKAKVDHKDPSGRSLLVSFNWVTDIVNFFKGVNYYVYFIDDAYKYAVVGTPKKDMLWILTRDERIEPETLKKLLEIAEKNGFNLDNLIYDIRN
nr:hypothetical protein GTC16762_11630 [Pigmentibacter ruber]